MKADLLSDEVPLVLLAALAHPTSAVRERLRRQLDALIEERQPIHSDADVRACLAAQLGTPLEPFFLDPLSMEIAVRLVRLVFAWADRERTERRVRIVSSAVFATAGGLVVNADLMAVYYEKLLSGRSRPAFFGEACLVAGMVRPRLEQFSGPGRLLRVTCRAEAGFCLVLQGEMPWKASACLPQGSRLAVGKPFSALGLRFEEKDADLHLRTTTPESIIQFSACLARGEALILSEGSTRKLGRVVVQLRDFEDDVAQLPAQYSYTGAETWLQGAPALPFALADEDRMEIARWAYPPERWLVEKLL